MFILFVSVCFCLFLFVGILLIMIIPSMAQAASPAVLFVFDGSGSMWGQVDGKTKIDLAKNGGVDKAKLAVMIKRRLEPGSMQKK